jgi:YD repeat-containing protein
MARKVLTACVLVPLLTLVSAAGLADSLTYVYDALGRLTEVRYPNGSVVSYTLDPAGNRTEVASRTLPGVPASITVPANNSTGSYTISWGAASGTVTAYQLYEAAAANFSGQVEVYSGTATSRAISGKTNGTYYYRVRACNGTLCSGYRTGANPVTVNIPVPAAPATISGPSQNTTGNYSISWAASTGATRYELWQSANSGPFTKVHDGTARSKSFTNVPNGEYLYRAKACNAVGCSPYSPSKFVMVCVGGCN